MSYRVTRVDPKLHNTHIEAKCMLCSGITQIIVPTVQFDAFRDGELIQNAMPQLSASVRELLISSTCGTCFDDIFADNDEDENEIDLDDLTDIDLPDFGIPDDDFYGDTK